MEEIEVSEHMKFDELPNNNFQNAQHRCIQCQGSPKCVSDNQRIRSANCSVHTEEGRRRDWRATVWKSNKWLMYFYYLATSVSTRWTSFLKSHWAWKSVECSRTRWLDGVVLSSAREASIDSTLSCRNTVMVNGKLITDLVRLGYSFLPRCSLEWFSTWKFYFSWRVSIEIIFNALY